MILTMPSPSALSVTPRSISTTTSTLGGANFVQRSLKPTRRSGFESANKQPDVLVEPARRGDVGPLQSLIDELEFNEALAKACEDRDEAICPFEITQFSRAISEG